jgi:hypothetical protein
MVASPSPPQAKPGMQRVDVHFYPSLRIAVTQRFRNERARGALYHTEVFLNGLITQWNRLADMNNRLQNLIAKLSPSDPQVLGELSQLQDIRALDVHFYLICWDKLDKFLTVFEREQSDPAVSQLVAGARPLLKSAAQGRNFLEHLDKSNDGWMRGIQSMYFNSIDGGQAGLAYTDVSNRGRKIPRHLDLGRREVVRMIDLYVGILRHLGATV